MNRCGYLTKSLRAENGVLFQVWPSQALLNEEPTCRKLCLVPVWPNQASFLGARSCVFDAILLLIGRSKSA